MRRNKTFQKEDIEHEQENVGNKNRYLVVPARTRRYVTIGNPAISSICCVRDCSTCCLIYPSISRKP